MLTSSTLTFSMASGERKRCSNMAPVGRLRRLAWMKARRLPGVRCSTLNTECKSLLCLMIMPGRSWVAGIDIAGLHLLHSARNSGGGAGPESPRAHFWPAGVELAGASAALGIKTSFYTAGEGCGNPPARESVNWQFKLRGVARFQSPITNHKLPIQHSGLE